MVRLVIIGAIILIGAIVSIFTVSSKEAVRFNDAAVAAASRVDSGFAPIGVILSSYGEGTAVDVAKLRSKVEAEQAILDKELATLKGIKVPDEATCRNFHTALLAYFDNNQALVKKYGDVVAYIEKHNPGSEADSNVVDAMLTDLAKKDGQLMSAVQSSQKALASKHNITLK